jgi:hypothetical protein
MYSILFSEYAVYVLVFNMEWLLPGSPDTSACLAYLRHWLHAVGVYCRHTSILLVGTRKDRVRDPREHEAVSDALYAALRSHPSWPAVSEFRDGELSTGRGVLCFFPVDNTLGGRDPVVSRLMRSIEKTVREADHLRHSVPFAWLALLDRVEALKQERRLALPIAEVVLLGTAAGMPSGAGMVVEAEARLALQFLDRLGLVMHHPAVPDLVILRPAEFLFPYFTKIICNFQVRADVVR